ncbi:hypothetical protein GGE65_000861 [Skermanella aerolata]|uniref:hypothetical protein n=1 Tax=Skermanella aerolata TaxID=393310 RepID=UPI003D25AF80
MPFRIAFVPLLILVAAFLALAGIATYTAHPLATRAIVSQSAQSATSGPIRERSALSAEEEVYAAELGQIHGAVKLAAVEMSFAGVLYKTEHHDTGRLVQTIRSLSGQFAAAADHAGKLQTPASMQDIGRRYLAAVDLYVTASAEMMKVSQDAGDNVNDAYLIDAQAMTHRAAEELLRVGDRLWPGEYKPH